MKKVKNSTKKSKSKIIGQLSKWIYITTKLYNIN